MSYHSALDSGDYEEFRIVVQNLGIPLHNIGMSLQYSPEMGFGGATVPLKTKDGQTIREGQFAKGAITEFTFATDRLRAGADSVLGTLADLKTQRARLTLHADQYTMWSLRLHDRLWWLKRRWNRCASWLTHKTRREVLTPRGTMGIKHLVSVPTFDSPGLNLLRFTATVRKSPPRV